MLTKSEYELLMDIRELPNDGFPEQECPAYIEWARVFELITLGYMERATLSLPGDDPQYPEGRSWCRISALGYHLIEEYENHLVERKSDLVSSLLGNVISAMPKR